MQFSASRRPSWVDAAAYPFTDRWLGLEAGRLHYLDEGQGRPVVMVHGTPSWSFLYRHLIDCLAPRWRAVVPDHIGFGLSDKPLTFPYRPADHARNLDSLISYLGLKDVTLVVHDFGGPIGLAYAAHRPQNVRALIIMNTFMWSLQSQLRYRASEKLFTGVLGRVAYLRLNASPRFLVPLAFGDRSKLTPEVHAQYTAPFSRAEERRGPLVLAQELTRSGRWYDSLWRERAALAAKPTLLLWGMRDRFMPPSFLERWREAFPQAQVRTFSQAGHFLQEEEPEEVCREVRRFLRGLDAAEDKPDASGEQSAGGHAPGEAQQPQLSW